MPGSDTLDTGTVSATNATGAGRAEPGSMALGPIAIIFSVLAALDGRFVAFFPHLSNYFALAILATLIPERLFQPGRHRLQRFPQQNF